MAKAYVRIVVENRLEIDVPDNLTQYQVFDYIMENCQDDIDLAIHGGDFYLDIEETEGLEECDD